MTKNQLWRMPIILAICMLVFFSSGRLGALTNVWFTTQFGHYTNASHFFFKLYMILISIGMMTILGKGRLAGFGFRRATNVHWGSMAWKSATIISISLFFVVLIPNAVYTMITGNMLHGFPNNSLINEILSVWIWSSLSEEIFTRGLLQSYLDPLKHFRFMVGRVSISLPVVVSALFFSCMHLPLLKLNFTPVFVFSIVTNTFVIGMLASYYREKSSSLLPPVLIHVMANIIGFLPNLLR